MEGASLKKLAATLGISVSTVSKAFQDSYDISPQTKQKVLELARQWNYEPNPYASSLRKQKSKTIAVILPEIANNFFSLAIRGIESVAREKGYHVLIYLTHEAHENEIAFTQHVQSGRVDGVLISLTDGTLEHTHLDLLQEKGIPIVYFDRVYEGANTAQVTTNDYESGYNATCHLIEKGCKKIAHFYFEKNLSIANRRKAGYLQALQDHHLPHNPKDILDFSFDQELNYQKMVAYLKQEYRPDGIFCSFEKLAILTYQICQELQITIPEDIKIISFSNLETAPFLNPSLSTITQPAFEIGQQAARILFKALDKGLTTTNEPYMIPSVIIERRSTQA